MKKILLTGLLIASANACRHDVDSDIIELDDFQDMNESSEQYPSYEDYHQPENIETVLKSLGTNVVKRFVQ